MRQDWKEKKRPIQKAKSAVQKEMLSCGLRHAFNVAEGFPLASPSTDVQSQTGVLLILESVSLFVFFLNKKSTQSSLHGQNQIFFSAMSV